MEKVIVTGGAGFIGSHIVDALVAEGYEVHIVDNLFSGKKENCHPKAVFHDLDIRDRAALDPIFKGVRYVFHEAAIPQVEYSIKNPLETHRINLSGLLNVLEASRIHGIKRLIFAASSAAYGNQDILPLVETMAAMPLSPYGAEKYMGEVYCELWARIYGLETVSLRYFNVYGPRQSFESAYASVIAKFLDLRARGKPLTITGDGTQTRDFVHIKDVVSANLLAMKRKNVGKGEVLNIGGTRKITINEIAALIGGSTEYIDQRVEPRATEADVTKAHELLGWQPTVSIEKGIEELKNNHDK